MFRLIKLCVLAFVVLSSACTSPASGGREVRISEQEKFCLPPEAKSPESSWEPEVGDYAEYGFSFVGCAGEKRRSEFCSVFKSVAGVNVSSEARSFDFSDPKEGGKFFHYVHRDPSRYTVRNAPDGTVYTESKEAVPGWFVWSHRSEKIEGGNELEGRRMEAYCDDLSKNSSWYGPGSTAICRRHIYLDGLGVEYSFLIVNKIPPSLEENDRRIADAINSWRCN